MSDLHYTYEFGARIWVHDGEVSPPETWSDDFHPMDPDLWMTVEDWAAEVLETLDLCKVLDIPRQGHYQCVFHGRIIPAKSSLEDYDGGPGDKIKILDSKFVTVPEAYVRELFDAADEEDKDLGGD